MEATRQQQLGFGARDQERWQLLDNLRLLGRSSLSGRVRALVELVGRVAGDNELCWTIDGPLDARDCLASRLNETPRTVRRTIQAAEDVGVLAVRRMRRQDRTLDRLALSVRWNRLAARDFGTLTAARVVPSGRSPVAAEPAATVRPTWPDSPANLAAPEWPTSPSRAANLAAQYKQEQAIPPPPPKSPATATAAEPRGDTGQGEETSWAAAAECLRLTGFASWRRLVADCQRQGLTPTQLVEACGVYQANAGRFRGPGAIAGWVRNGDWPVEGVKPAGEARAVAVDAQQAERREDLERWAQSVILTGRRKGLPRAAIGAALAKRGYVWT